MTLVEVMLVVVVFAALVGIAFPSYTESVERSRRGKAIADIANIQLLIGRYESSRGELPDALTDIDPKGFVDPWGKAYFYTNLAEAKGKGSARKDHKLNPINSDFDLFSAGKNGVFKTQITQKDSVDDIIRARDGAFVGVAADFSK
jgi:general secretion pathway protein G